MKCPIDGTPLETHTVQSVNVEECAQCRGLWFEKGELRKTKDASEPDLNWLDFDLWSDPASFAADWSSRQCPQCGKHMAAISYAETGVTVDYCAEGHGVWLDKGEFQAIVKALNTEAESKNASDYVTASLAEALEILTGDEGIISEWKDFATVMRLLQYRVLAENPRLSALLSAIQSASPF